MKSIKDLEDMIRRNRHNLEPQEGDGGVDAALAILEDVKWHLDGYADRLDEAKGFGAEDEDDGALEVRITRVARLLGHHPQPEDQ